MIEDAPSSGHVRIDAIELTRVEVIDDGRRLCLRLRDRAGCPVSVRLPVECLNAVLTAVPQSRSQWLTTGQAETHTLDSWSLDQGEHGLILTLHRADGARVAFAVKPWQIAAMASLAGHGPALARGRLN